MRPGVVSLIGAGPGHADYLTLGALRAIESSDVILYDALIGADIQAFFPSKVNAIYVGKRCGRHSLSQSQINERLIFYARQGIHVVRLKGGDPFIFGRGGEEIAALQRAGIPFRVLPGVSALNGVAAAVGLPLTSRTHSNEFRVIQGHNLPSKSQVWRSLADYEGTLVIFMGMARLRLIVARLIESGAPLDRPMAVIETDIDGQQVVSRGQLQSFYEQEFIRRSSGPGIIYIGQNVGLMPESSQLHVMEAPHGLSIADFS